MRLAGSHSWEVEVPGGNPAAGPCLTSVGLRWARKCEAGGHSQGGCETKLRAVWRRATQEQPGWLWHCQQPPFPGFSDTALCRGEALRAGAGWEARPTHLSRHPHPSPSPLTEGDGRDTTTELLPLARRTLRCSMAHPTPAPAPGEASRTLLPLSCLGKGLVATAGWHRDTAG